jgi:phosphinothricin acetyltransferase
MLNIRKAGNADLPSITDIYNDAVANTTATFDTQTRTLEDRTQWFNNRDENFPIFVAEKNKQIVGYASLNKWSDKKGYDRTAEISLYILPGYQGEGIGKQLIEFIVAEAEETHLHSIIARITEGNEVSIHLHKAVGFEVTGHLKEAGFKFERYLDVTIMQKMLRNQ